MAHHKSAEKRIRQTKKRRLQNMHITSTMRTAIKRVEKAIQSKQIEQARDLLKKAVPLIDKAASKGIIHRNNAARHVSRIAQKVNTLEAGT